MQPSIDAKVPNMLGDERMTLIKCNCGAKYDRMASHKKTYWDSNVVIAEQTGDLKPSLRQMASKNYGSSIMSAAADLIS